MTTYTFDGHLTPQDKADSDYCYLPFEVPEGISHIHVQYDFTRTGHAAHKGGDENVIDIGLFDPGDTFSEEGFRGWSGSDRAEFTVGLTDATPGYIAGPIPSGTWRIILGLYKIAPEGCYYHATVTLARGSQSTPPLDAPVAPTTRRVQALRSGPGWYRGDLHSHTHHSDAQASVGEIVDAARSRGLDYLAITDHNTISHLFELDDYGHPDLLLIPGMEVTTYYGHANLWGLSRWVDFRCRDAETMRRIMAAAHAQGALFAINHPRSPIGGIWEYGWIEGADVVEVWNTVWLRSNYSALVWWDELLQRGRRVVAVGGSDRHQPRNPDPHYPYQLGAPTTWVYAQHLSAKAILAGIQAGHAFITAQPDGPQVTLSARAVDGRTAIMGDLFEYPAGTQVTLDCEVRGARGHILELVRQGQETDRRELGEDTTRLAWTLPVESDGYVRAQVIGSRVGGGIDEPGYPLMLALTNPIYLRAHEA